MKTLQYLSVPLPFVKIAENYVIKFNSLSTLTIILCRLGSTVELLD